MSDDMSALLFVPERRRAPSSQVDLHYRIILHRRRFLPFIGLVAFTLSFLSISFLIFFYFFVIHSSPTHPHTHIPTSHIRFDRGRRNSSLPSLRCPVAHRQEEARVAGEIWTIWWDSHRPLAWSASCQSPIPTYRCLPCSAWTTRLRACGLKSPLRSAKCMFTSIYHSSFMPGMMGGSKEILIM